MISRDFVPFLSTTHPKGQSWLRKYLTKHISSSYTVSLLIVAPPKQFVVLAASFLDSMLAYHDVVVVILALSIFHRRCTSS